MNPFKFGTIDEAQNHDFKFSATYRNTTVPMPKWDFKCKSTDFNQKIGEIPVITLGFSR